MALVDFLIVRVDWGREGKHFIELQLRRNSFDADFGIYHHVVPLPGQPVSFVINKMELTSNRFTCHIADTVGQGFEFFIKVDQSFALTDEDFGGIPEGVHVERDRRNIEYVNGYPRFVF